MKINTLKPLLVLLLFCAVSSAFCQLGMKLSLNRSVYMQYEPVYACVTIRNNSGRPLLFGQDPKLQGFISFIIRDKIGRVIPKRPNKEINVQGLLLKPGEVKNMVLPVNEYYQLDTPGIYSINVCVAHNMLPKEYVCLQDKAFMIDTGIEIWSQTTGVPDLSEQPSGTKMAKDRKYSIRMLTEQPNKHYYLFVEDDDTVYGVSRIGKKVGTEKFKAEVDMLGRIHLLMPISSKVFHYLTFSIDGINTANSYWKTAGTIPTLHRDLQSGIVTRIGGVAAKRGIDYVEYTGTPASKLTGKTPAPLAAEGMTDLNKDISLTGNDATD